MSAKVLVRNGLSVIVLLVVTGTARGGWNRLCFELDNELDLDVRV